MFENDISTRSRPHPLLTIIVILIAAAIGFLAGYLIVFYCYLPFFDGNETELASAIENIQENPHLKSVVYIMQAGATVVGLIAVPLYLLSAWKISLSSFFTKHAGLTPVVVTFLMVVFFMAVNSVFIEWNQEVNFPEGLKWFEDWAREKENLAKEQTTILTTFNSVTEFIIGLIVIAVLPAFGEELVFRGLIQNEIYRGTKNIHVSIWIAAILFSAIHLQFFGFVPRMLLGALFGYLYYWSGNLWYAIWAHAVNNGVSVIAMYLYQRGTFTYDLESPEAAPPHMIMISAVLTGGLLYYFYTYFANRKREIHRL